MDIDVSIIIVNYNTCGMTSDCIKSIYEKTEGVLFEIILVDNASVDGSKETFENDSRLLYIYLNENIGFGRANNEGLKRARGRNIFFLNSDTILINNAIKLLSEYLDQEAYVGAVGGNLYSCNGESLHSYRRLSPLLFEVDVLFAGIPSKLCYRKNKEHNHTKKSLIVNTIVGADLMVKRKVLDQVGAFDNRFFMYCEETDLCHRIRNRGYNIVSIPNARIIHLEGASFSKNRMFERIKMNRKSLYLYCSIHYNKIYVGLVDIVWKMTIYSRILVYSLIGSPKKNFWKKIKKTIYDT